MRTFGKVVDDLGRAVAALALTPSDVSYPDALVAARTAVFDGVRHTVDALTLEKAPPRRPAVADLQLEPARALRAALHHLPRPRPGLSLADAMADALVPEPWARAASASLELLKFEPVLGSLRHPERWTALGVVADIAGTLVVVDEDLKGRLRGAGLPDRRSLAAVRIAANAVVAEAHRRPTDRAIGNLGEPIPSRPIAIRRAADIPVALDRIVAMVQARGAHLSMHDLGGVLVPLARSLHDASQVLRVASWHIEQPGAVLDMARHADGVRNVVAAIARHRTRVMTIGPASQELIGQALEMQGAMRTLLEYTATPSGAANLGPARVSHEVVARSWAVLSGLRLSVAAAVDRGQLLVRDRGLRLGEATWMPAAPQDVRVTELLSDLHAGALAARTGRGQERESARTLGLWAVEPLARNEVSPARRQDMTGRTGVATPRRVARVQASNT